MVGLFDCVACLVVLMFGVLLFVLHLLDDGD